MNNNTPNPLSAPLLTADQAKALQFLARWKNQTVETFVRGAVVGAIQDEFWDLREAAGSVNPDEKAWAAKFFDQVEPLMGLSEEEKAWGRQMFLDNDEAAERAKAILDEQLREAKREAKAKKGGAK